MIDPHARNVRVGVMLANLTDAASCTAFDGMDAKWDKGLGDILDQANRRFGLQSVGIGYAGIKGRGRAHQETGAKWSIFSQLEGPMGITPSPEPPRRRNTSSPDTCAWASRYPLRRSGRQPGAAFAAQLDRLRHPKVRHNPSPSTKERISMAEPHLPLTRTSDLFCDTDTG